MSFKLITILGIFACNSLIVASSGHSDQIKINLQDKVQLYSIQCNDRKEIVITDDIMEQSETLKNYFADFPESSYLQLPEVDSETFSYFADLIKTIRENRTNEASSDPLFCKLLINNFIESLSIEQSVKVLRAFDYLQAHYFLRKSINALAKHLNQVSLNSEELTNYFFQLDTLPESVLEKIKYKFFRKCNAFKPFYITNLATIKTARNRETGRATFDVKKMLLSKNGKWFLREVSYKEDNQTRNMLYIHNLQKDTHKLIKDYEGTLTCAFSSDEQQLLAVATNGHVVIVRLEDCSKKEFFLGHRVSENTSCSFINNDTAVQIGLSHYDTTSLNLLPTRPKFYNSSATIAPNKVRSEVQFESGNRIGFITPFTVHFSCGTYCIVRHAQNRAFYLVNDFSRELVPINLPASLLQTGFLDFSFRENMIFNHYNRNLKKFWVVSFMNPNAPRMLYELDGCLAGFHSPNTMIFVTEQNFRVVDCSNQEDIKELKKDLKHNFDKENEEVLASPDRTKLLIGTKKSVRCYYNITLPGISTYVTLCKNSTFEESTRRFNSAFLSNDVIASEQGKALNLFKIDFTALHSLLTNCSLKQLYILKQLAINSSAIDPHFYKAFYDSLDDSVKGALQGQLTINYTAINSQNQMTNGVLGKRHFDDISEKQEDNSDGKSEQPFKKRHKKENW